MSHRFRNRFLKMSVTSHEPGIKIGVQAQQVVGNKHLSVTMHAGADADNRDRKIPRHVVRQTCRNFFENKAKTTCLFE